MNESAAPAMKSRAEAPNFEAEEAFGAGGGAVDGDAPGAAAGAPVGPSPYWKNRYTLRTSLTMSHHMRRGSGVLRDPYRSTIRWGCQDTVSSVANTLGCYRGTSIQTEGKTTQINVSTCHVLSLE